MNFYICPIGFPCYYIIYLREGATREGKDEGGYSGSFLISKLDLDAQFGDDSKYSVTLESCGEVSKVGSGLATV